MDLHGWIAVATLVYATTFLITRWLPIPITALSVPVILVSTGVIDDRTLVNATLGVSEIQLGEDYGQLRITLWGQNLTDEEYYIGNIRQGSFDSLGLLGLATFGDPLTYGVTLEYEYF